MRDGLASLASVYRETGARQRIPPPSCTVHQRPEGSEGQRKNETAPRRNGRDDASAHRRRSANQEGEHEQSSRLAPTVVARVSHRRFCDGFARESLRRRESRACATPTSIPAGMAPGCGRRLTSRQRRRLSKGSHRARAGRKALGDQDVASAPCVERFSIEGGQGEWEWRTR